jgi:hypothetical protein
VGRLELPRQEVVLLIGRHVAVLAAPHVEVRSHRARLEAVLLERVEPELHELLVDVGVGAQQLRDVELDARTDALLGDGGDERLGRVETCGELARHRVQGGPELDAGAGDAVSHADAPSVVGSQAAS